MSTLLDSVIELGTPKGSVLFNLAAFGAGASAVAERISEGQSGIYAWFRSYNFSDNTEEFHKDLIRAIEAPKFQPRHGNIVPYYGLTIESRSKISDGKADALRQAINNPSFKDSMRLALQWSILFQAPLYIGKSVNLKRRIEQHLRTGSVLRERLESVSIDIEKSYLLIIPIDEVYAASDASTSELDESSEALQYETLFEEVFSRLFNPLFTVRLG
jgi:hypothetical protein